MFEYLKLMFDKNTPDNRTDNLSCLMVLNIFAYMFILTYAGLHVLSEVTFLTFSLSICILPYFVCTMPVRRLISAIAGRICN